MNDFLVTAVMLASFVLLVYWFWPGKARCVACKSELERHYCYCTNLTCRYATRQQSVSGD